MPTFKDFAKSMDVDSVENITPFQLIHKNLHMPVYLSTKQAKCLTLLIQGKSAKEIAIKMKLSYRTIEHYIEKIRNQLGCSSTK